MSSELQNDILRVLSLLEVQAVHCGKIRIGGANDGGYVMADDFHENRICYSIGVGPQVFWDEEMANRGMDIHQYDHTVEGLPQLHPLFHFNRIGIGPDLSEPDLITLEEMLRRNGDLERQNMLLKIDVEGAEWDVLDAMGPGLLDNFDQIVIEFHAFEYFTEDSFRRRAERVFRKINATHTAIHVHANNYGESRFISGIHLPTVFELSYCRRGRFDFLPSTEIFPTELDQPCDPARPDIFLGNFKFRRL